MQGTLGLLEVNLGAIDDAHVQGKLLKQLVDLKRSICLRFERRDRTDMDRLEFCCRLGLVER